MNSTTGKRKVQVNAERRIGLMGGAFNPVHYGHLSAAEEARERFHLEMVIFLPCGRPVWPKDELADGEARFSMVALAIAENESFTCSRLELERSGPSYTADTLRYFRASHPDWRLFFITGLDAVMEFDSWRDPEEVLQLAELLVVNRPPYQVPPSFPLSGHPRVHLIDTPGLALSSREIRDRVRSGRSIRYLVPPLVAATIMKEKHYQERKEQIACG